jgi:hypothetical protein
MKALLLTITILLSFHTYARAATIVVFWTDEDMVVGADSKLIVGGGLEVKLVCKIGVVRNLLWAADGLLTVSGDTFVANIVSEEMGRNRPLAETFDTIGVRLRGTLSNIFDSTRRTTPTLTRRFMTQIIFGYFSDNKPALDFVQVAANPPSYDPQIVRIHCPSEDQNCLPGGRFILGQRETILTELSSSPDILRLLSIGGAINHFIDEESAIHPDVGGPIAIARLTSGGIKWVQQGKCDESPGHYTCDNASDPACSPK